MITSQWSPSEHSQIPHRVSPQSTGTPQTLHLHDIATPLLTGIALLYQSKEGKSRGFLSFVVAYKQLSLKAQGTGLTDM